MMKHKLRTFKKNMQTVNQSLHDIGDKFLSFNITDEERDKVKEQYLSKFDEWLTLVGDAIREGITQKDLDDALLL